MKRWLATSLSLLVAGLLCLALNAQAQMVPLTGAGGRFKAASAGGCSQATTFLGRTSLAGSDVTNYTNLICGMVTDSLITGDLSTTGCGSLFDIIYDFATADEATALFNLCGTSYSATNSGMPFTAYSGFTGDGHRLDVPFNPTTATSPNYTQNSAHFSEWNLTNGAQGVSDIDLFAGGAAGQNLYPSFAGSMYARVNDNPDTGGFSVSDPRGHLLGNRSTSTARQLYQNASTTLIGGTAATYGSAASQAPVNSAFTLLAGGGTRTMAMFSLGASLNSTQVTNFYNRLRTYMTAVGVP